MYHYYNNRLVHQGVSFIQRRPYSDYLLSETPLDIAHVDSLFCDPGLQQEEYGHRSPFGVTS